MTGYFQALERFIALLQRAEYRSVYENLLHVNCTVACKTWIWYGRYKSSKNLEELSQII